MKKISFSVLLLWVAAWMFAAPTATYYTSIEGKKGDSIRWALHDTIDNHTVISYSVLEDYYPNIDARIDDATKVWDIYSTCSFGFDNANCSQKAVCDCWNKEHTVPQSWFSKASPMVSDLFHVLPTDARVNNFRSNYAYGMVSDHSSPVCGSDKALGWRDTNKEVFEPVDEYKGDIARIYFYMATRYADKCSSWSGGMFGSAKSGFTAETAAMLMQWHRQDPVSKKEILRNDAVYAVQKNRNPFVDYPCLAEYIWGTKSTEAVNMANLLGSFEAGFTVDNCDGCTGSGAATPMITSPSNGSDFTMDATAVGERVSSVLVVKGQNLTKALTVAVEGANFEVSTTTISAAEANAGKNITVYYQPTSAGAHTATLTISSTECTSEVTLRGNCGFKALAATNITATGFCANWSDASVANYSLDVYTKEVSGTVENILINDSLDNKTTNGTLSGATYWENTTSLRLGTNSGSGKVSYSPLNVAQGGKVIVKAKAYNNDTEVMMQVTVGAATKEFTLTSAFADYEFAFEANAANTAATITVASIQAKKRVVLDNVSVLVGGEAVEKTSAAGYPQLVGNVLSHCVTGLNASEVYYYTVTPVGATVSNEVEVHLLSVGTSMATADADIRCLVYDGYVRLQNLPMDSHIELYDCTGRLVKRLTDSLDGVIAIPSRGVYVVRVSSHSGVRNFKIMY